MLLNKFRTKYGVRAEIDERDNIIKVEVENLLLSGTTTEAALSSLDKRLASILGTQNSQGQPKSQYSNQDNNNNQPLPS